MFLTLEPRHIDLPQHARLYAFSDLHGCLDLFNKSIEGIRHHLAQNPLKKDQPVYALTLGDLIDKGPDSCGLITAWLGVKDLTLIGLIGNHEKYVIDFLSGPAPHLACDTEWRDNTLWWIGRSGGHNMLKSYGIDVPQAIIDGINDDAHGIDDAMVESFEEIRLKLLLRLHERNHLTYFAKLNTTALCGHFVFCHAQLLPDRAATEHQLAQIIHGREIVTYDGSFHEGHIVIRGHSHTPGEQPPYLKRHNIGIDPQVFHLRQPLVAVFDGNDDIMFIHENNQTTGPFYYPRGPRHVSPEDLGTFFPTKTTPALPPDLPATANALTHAFHRAAQNNHPKKVARRERIAAELVRRGQEDSPKGRNNLQIFLQRLATQTAQP